LSALSGKTRPSFSSPESWIFYQPFQLAGVAVGDWNLQDWKMTDWNLADYNGDDAENEK